ncbi:MAG: MIP family channel protein [Chloroflexi bacterium]|nr:MIP family channel protein [Chloroflexota bacterium]
MTQLGKQALVEAIATFVLIFIGAGSIVANAAAGTFGSGLVAVALAHGLAIFTGVAATGHISGGHINPAVTVGFLITRRISVRTAAVYILAQLVGAVVAGLLLRALFAEAVYAQAGVHLGATELGGGVSFATGTLVEAILTFLLVFVVFQTAGHPEGPKAIAPLAIGLTIAMDILAGGPLTGAAMNPARAFGPAVAGGYWGNHLVYWIGPIVGGALAALVAHYLVQGRQREQDTGH